MITEKNISVSDVCAAYRRCGVGWGIVDALVGQADLYMPLARVWEACERSSAVKGWHGAGVTPGFAFLDSSLQGRYGRWSILGIGPAIEWTQRGDVCRRNGKTLPHSLETELSAWLACERADNDTDLPLTAGVIGYCSYDFGRGFVSVGTRHPCRSDLPDARFVHYDVLLIEDHRSHTISVVAHGMLASARRELEQTMAWLRGIAERPSQASPARLHMLAKYEADYDAAGYRAMVRKLIGHLRDGDAYVVNLSQRMRGRGGASPQAMYRYLRTHNPAPFGAYLQYGGATVVSASPERFLQVRRGMVETRPIKGTRPRGGTEEQDDALRRELEESEKDRAELLMVVDLERNDLSRICEPGSVEVTGHCAIESYATVHHLVSTVRGRLLSDVGFADLLRATFPGGSITGAPKKRSMELIDELERSRRGLYTGIIGWLSLDGDCDFNIAIRTAVHEHGEWTLGAGGGLTIDSDPAFEHRETLQKAKALLEAIGNEEGTI